MAFDELKNMAKGWVRTWNKGKLQKKLKETAQHAIDLTIELSEVEQKYRQLEDENRRLKNEKSKPKIKPVSTKELNSSKKKKHKKSSKIDKLEIDEEVELDVDEELPTDAKFIGHREVIIQELRYERRNIKFKLRRYLVEGRTVEASLPEQFKGREFGPELRSFILYQYYKNRVPHKKIQDMLNDLGISMSAGTINSILNQPDITFEVDMNSAKEAGLKKCSYVYLDETGAKYKGVQYYTHGIGNSYFSEFVTTRRKSQETAKEVLGSCNRYPIRFLISDDAPNFNKLIKNHQLCWVHEIRKYKLCEAYQKIESRTLDKVLRQWRKFYHLMNRFLKHPRDELRKKIREEFNRITSIETLVKPIDKQLRLTKKNEKKLLLFLTYPQIPIQSNMIERDLRERVIKRKISMQNRSKEGMKAWDLMLSLASTCRKNNLSFWKYLTDRIHRRDSIPYLGKIIAST